MKKIKYVLVYPNGNFLKIDKDSGYPYECESDPTLWYFSHLAEEYSKQFSNKNLKLMELEYSLKEYGLVAKEIEVFVDRSDFAHEIGEGNAPGPHNVYNTLAEIKEKQPCVEGCGVVRAKLVELGMAQPINDDKRKQNPHILSFSEEYQLMKIALNEISNSVESTMQKKIADNVLKKIKNA